MGRNAGWIDDDSIIIFKEQYICHAVSFFHNHFMGQHMQLNHWQPQSFLYSSFLSEQPISFYFVWRDSDFVFAEFWRRIDLLYEKRRAITSIL